MLDDASLIQRTLDGDRESFSQLVAKYRAAVIGLAIKRVANIADAQDIAQEVFIAAFGKLHLLRDKDRFGGWLRSIALRTCGMWLRSRNRGPHSSPLVEEVTETHHPAPDGEVWVDVGRLIEQLPAGLREAAVLCFEDELSASAAAVVLGITPGALRKRLYDSRVRLQRQIVERAEKELQIHLLPKNFAERCVCRCARATRPKEVRIMDNEKQKNCGCGCNTSAKAQKAQKPPKSKK